MFLTKDLKAQCASVALKRGTAIQNIRLTGNEEVECNAEKVKGLRFEKGIAYIQRQLAIRYRPMTENTHKIKFFRERIPSFTCVPGCHDCCGPVMTSSEEMAALPVKTDVEHEVALAALSCPHLGAHGCEVYDERPLICRLFGTTPKLVCPNGKRPEVIWELS